MTDYPLDSIHPNPWQPRTDEDQVHLLELAISILQHGLLQIPTARPHPNRPGHIQLAFGHSRLAAYRLLAEGRSGLEAAPADWQTFPVIVRDLTDRQMSDLAAEENMRRRNLSALEIARAIRRRMDDFRLSQREAGAPFGYTSQGGVDNLLRLLQLPDPIQQHVHRGVLPERLARGLIALSRSLPDQACKIADATTQVEAKEEFFDNALERTLQEYGRRLYDPPWKNLKWTGAIPEVLAPTAAKIGLNGALPPCAGCEFHIEHAQRDFCVRPRCYDLKAQAFATLEAARIAKKIGGQVLAKGETAEVIYDGDDRTERLAAKALLTRHPSLRVATVDVDGHDYGEYGRARVLGSGQVQLLTTDMAGLKKAIAQLPAEKKSSAVERAQDGYRREQKKMRERQAETRRLLRAGAGPLAAAFKFPEPLLEALIAPMSSRHFAQTSTQIEERAKKADRAGKQQLIAELVLSGAVPGASYMYSSVTPAAVRKEIVELAARLRVCLPAGWEAERPPAKAQTKRKAGRK